MTDVAVPARVRGRRAVPWLLAGALLLAAALPGGLAQAHLVARAPTVGVGRAVAPPTTFNLNLTDAPSFAPRTINATASAATTFTFDLDNVGSLPHTFTLLNVSQSGHVLKTSMTPEALDAYFNANGTSANVSLAGGATAAVSVSLTPGPTPISLEFVSVVPYQFQAGMWGFFNVTEAGPTVVLSENTTDQLSFVPNELSAGPSITGPVSLHIQVSNLGSLGHTFTVSSQVNVTLSSIGNFSTHPPLVNVSVPGGAGGSVWANFTVAVPGVYEYACTVPGHFTAGMYGFLYVGVAVPPAPPTPSNAVVEIPILAGSAVLLGIGAALAFASAYVGRLPRRPASSHQKPGA